MKCTEPHEPLQFAVVEGVKIERTGSCLDCEYEQSHESGMDLRLEKIAG